MVESIPIIIPTSHSRFGGSASTMGQIYLADKCFNLDPTTPIVIESSNKASELSK